MPPCWQRNALGLRADRTSVISANVRRKRRVDAGMLSADQMAEHTVCCHGQCAVAVVLRQSERQSEMAAGAAGALWRWPCAAQGNSARGVAEYRARMRRGAFTAPRAPRMVRSSADAPACMAEPRAVPPGSAEIPRPRHRSWTSSFPCRMRHLERHSSGTRPPVHPSHPPLHPVSRRHRFRGSPPQCLPVA